MAKLDKSVESLYNSRDHLQESIGKLNDVIAFMEAEIADMEKQLRKIDR